MAEDRMPQLVLDNQNLLKEKIKWLEEKVKLLEQIIELKDKPAKVEYIPYYPYYPTYPHYPVWPPTITWSDNTIPTPGITTTDGKNIDWVPNYATAWVPSYTSAVTMNKPPMDHVSIYADTGTICDTSNTTPNNSTTGTISDNSTATDLASVVIKDIKFQANYNYKKEQGKEMYRQLNKRLNRNDL